jgi:hypothetical protein
MYTDIDEMINGRDIDLIYDFKEKYNEYPPEHILTTYLEFLVSTEDDPIIEHVKMLIGGGAVITEDLLIEASISNGYDIWKYLIDNFGRITKELYKTLIDILENYITLATAGEYDDDDYLKEQEMKLKYLITIKLIEEEYIPRARQSQRKIKIFHILRSLPGGTDYTKAEKDFYEMNNKNNYGKRSKKRRSIKKRKRSKKRRSIKKLK